MKAFLALTSLFFATTACAGHDWVRINDGSFGADAVKGTVHEKYAIAPAGRVEVQNIGGSVKVVVGEAKAVEFNYERRAASQRDYDCETLRYEHTADSLRVWVERKREHEHDCDMIRASDQLTLSVPAGAKVSLEHIGDSVSVDGVEGLVELSSIGDSADVTNVRQLYARSIGDSLKLKVGTLGPEGIDVASVGDSVILDLPEALDADLRISSVGDEIKLPGKRISSGDDDNYQATLGKGGPKIRIRSVGDSVRVHGGPEGKGARWE